MCCRKAWKQRIDGVNEGEASSRQPVKKRSLDNNEQGGQAQGDNRGDELARETVYEAPDATDHVVFADAYVHQRNKDGDEGEKEFQPR